MDFILNALNNSWVSNLITGLAVYFLTGFFNKIKHKKQYFQKVELANKEIFNTIKFTIPEENLPSAQVLQSIHSATAKRYNVKIEHMSSLQEILDDVIKEIMDSNFLSHENKLRYCKRLLDLKGELTSEKKETTSNELVANGDISEYLQVTSRKERALRALLLSIYIVLSSVFITIVLSDNFHIIVQILLENNLIIYNIIIISLLLFTFSVSIIEKLVEQRKQSSDKESRD